MHRKPRTIRVAPVRSPLISYSAVLAAFLALGGKALAADGDITTPAVEVIGHYETAVGTSDTASEGAVTYKLIEDRPILRPGEILEFVPGMVVTQHSGDGKANQYFLRGYNLDHGTDFATYVEGMPVNNPTHAHGQGYSDLNFMIPELVNRIDFKKGPYFAEEGDFASAGSAHFQYFDVLPKGFATITAGSNDYERGVIAASPQVGNGHLLVGVEYQHTDGPWVNPERFNKLNGVLRLTQGDSRDGFSVDAMGYSGHWDSTDQIPLRAVEQGFITRFGTIDPTDGGDTSRYSLSFQGHHALNALGAPQLDVDAYLIRYSLDLISNFTFFLNDPTNGDQFEQSDRRTVYGLRPTLTWAGKLGSADTVNKLGLQVRYDDISRVALYNTIARDITSVTRQDDVEEGAFGLFGENTTQWTSWFRTVAGLRMDYYTFDVNSSIEANSGQTDAHITSPKLSFIFGPWNKTEYFINTGYGFHSNDARGTVITVDPSTLQPVDPVTPLVRTKGAEIGLRTEAIPKLQSSLSLWVLQQDSELLFTGDAGTTEPSRASRRQGVEWINFYRPLPWLTFDAEISYSQAKFTSIDPADPTAGDHIPGAVPWVAQFGVAVQDLNRWFGAFQLRYISPYPLIEDNSVRSDPSTIANMRVGYKFSETWSAHLDILNVFNSEAHDIDYYYCSRVKQDNPATLVACGDAGQLGTNDIHFHPTEPRQFRFTVAAHF